jgi:hypothetical protein
MKWWTAIARFFASNADTEWSQCRQTGYSRMWGVDGHSWPSRQLLAAFSTKVQKIFINLLVYCSVPARMN